MAYEQSTHKIGKSVGEKLRAARIALRYTQSQLAAPDFSVSYISAIERGQIHPSLRALEILAARLGLSATQLLPERSQPEDRHPGASSFERSDEIDFLLLEMYINIVQGQEQQAIERLHKVTVKRLKRSQQLQHRYLLALAHLRLGQFQESESLLVDAVQQAKESNNHFVYLRMFDTLGQLYAGMRNYTQALLYHQRCLSLLTDFHMYDPAFEAHIMNQIGQHYLAIGSLDQAVEMFEQALALLANLEEADLRSAYLSLAQHYLELEEFILVRLYIQKSAVLNDQHSIQRIHGELYYYLGRALLNRSKDEAKTFFDQLLRQDVLTDSLSLASIYTNYAEWELVNGTWQQACLYAQRANQFLADAGDTIMGAAALLALGRASYAGETYEEGDKYFVEGIAMLERLNDREYMVEQSIRYAELLEGRGKAREALAYFRRAFQGSQSTAY